MSTAQSYLPFRLASIECAIPIENVEYLSNIVALDKLPSLPATILGTCLFHGRLVFGIDISAAFDIDSHSFDSDSKMVLTSSEGLLFGILVDTVGELFEMKATQEITDQPVPAFPRYDHEFFFHNGKIIYIAEPCRFFTIEELESLRSVSQQSSFTMHRRLS